MQPFADCYPSLVQALHQCFGTHWRVENVTGPGYSRFAVFALHTHRGRFALKQHARERRDAVLSQHAFQQMLASTPGSCVPQLQPWTDGRTWMDDGPFGWELCHWVPGEPWPTQLRLAQDAWQQQLDAIIAMHRSALRWHDSSMDVVVLGSTASIPRGWTERRDRLHFWSASQHEWGAIGRAVATAWGANPQFAKALERVRGWLPELAEELEHLCRKGAPSWWIVRDMWRAHWLFDAGRLMGLIDFGAARPDWPGLDLVRAWGTMLDEDDPRWQSGCDRYSREIPEARIDVRTLKMVHRASVALSLLQWCEWCVSGKADRSAGPSPRFMELVQRVLTMA
jgi:Ser/Thr protein kinase RdoA (MazF antagonist)